MFFLDATDTFPYQYAMFVYLNEILESLNLIIELIRPHIFYCKKWPSSGRLFLVEKLNFWCLSVKEDQSIGHQYSDHA